MRRFVVAMVGVAAMSVAANAADLPVKAPPAPPPSYFSWTGFYVGVNAGYSWSTSTDPSTSACVEPAPPTGFCGYVAAGGFPPISLNPKGFIGGGQFGYNWQMANLVWGIEADFQGSGVRDAAVQTTTPPAAVTGTVSQDHKLLWFGTVRGRIGLPINNWLFYATGGLIYGDVRSSVTMTATNGFFATTSGTTTRAGWTVGAGAEVGFADHWTGRIEYLYYDLGTDSITPVATAAPFTGESLTYSQKTAGHIVRAALNYRF